MIPIMMRRASTKHYAVSGMLGIALALGLLAICHAAWSSSGDDLASASTSAAASASASVAAAGDDTSTMASALVATELVDDGEAGCRAILIACIIAAIGIGAMMQGHSRRRGGTLWRVPVPLRRVDGVLRLHGVSLFSQKRPAVLIC